MKKGKLLGVTLIVASAVYFVYHAIKNKKSRDFDKQWVKIDDITDDVKHDSFTFALNSIMNKGEWNETSAYLFEGILNDAANVLTKDEFDNYSKYLSEMKG